MKLLKYLRGVMPQPQPEPRRAVQDESKLQPVPHDFDADVYLELNPDVKAAAVDATLHYMQYGRSEGRQFRRLVDGPAMPTVSAQVVAEQDAPQPGMSDMAQLPADFNAAEYLALHADLADAEVDPIWHYLTFGQHEGRHYKPAAAAVPLSSVEQQLPDGFDPELYRKLHADLRDPQIDPALHYLSFGKQEGRIFSLPVIELAGEAGWRADRQTVLVVSHEASRTGAPVLSLNLVQQLMRTYNVVTLLLGGGALYDAFVQSGAVVAAMPAARGNGMLADHVITHLNERFSFKFALVNSIESRVALAPLAEKFVPVISLVHEFASYTRPRDAFRHALFWSGEVVFSAHITMENAFAEYPDLGQRIAHILPQGRCLLPADDLDPEEIKAESARLRRLIRPAGSEDAVIILGAGFVQLRKGVELFIECAARVMQAPGGENCRFVWIGKGYDPDNDTSYSVYLADQIRRAGLQKHVLFIDETSAIETAYEEADMLLLSSRLDPLPNVAIDVMTAGVPVLCFEKTTGIADFLIDSGLREACVARYLDSAELAGKILALCRDVTLRDDVARRCQSAALAYFSMDRYVRELEALVQEVAVRAGQERADTRTILESGLFNADFSCPSHVIHQTPEEQVRHYVRAWASGIDRRKPFPGFHPGVYLEQHGVMQANADPFADYLRQGQPQGAWNSRVVSCNDAARSQGGTVLRAALHLHVHYTDVLSNMLTRLAHNRHHPDLFISITSAAARAEVELALATYPGHVAAIEVVPNRGRDLGPFLSAFGARIMAGYDIVGHLHTKKSRDVKDATMGQKWYQFLMTNLLGGEARPMTDAILEAMSADATLGMVFPCDPHVMGLGDNLVFARDLGDKLGLATLPENFDFPIGSMFWARTAALGPLFNLGLSWDDYPEEPLPYNGTMLHAMERLLALVLALGTWRIAVTNVSKVTR